MNWQTRKCSNFTKCSILVWMIINSNKTNCIQWENCQKFAHKLFWNACTWQELDDLTSCGPRTSSQDQSENGLDKRFARLISYIHHTNDYRQHCNVENTAQHCRLGLFQDSDFEGDLEDSKSTIGGVLRIFGSRTLSQSVGCARNKHRFRTVLQNLKLFLWTLDYVWMGYLLSIFGTL